MLAQSRIYGHIETVWSLHTETDTVWTGNQPWYSWCQNKQKYGTFILTVAAGSILQLQAIAGLFLNDIICS